MRSSDQSIVLKKNLQILISLLTVGGLFWSLVVPQKGVSAAVNLTIEPITWNVVGLDSNNVLVGPNQFPVGGRVCNNGDTLATNVIVDFKWDDLNNDYTGDPYINLRKDSLSDITFSSIPAGVCRDAYFEVSITRDSGAYNNTRDYYMTVDSDQTSLVSTGKPREIFVEYLISQNRNATDNVSYGTSEASLTGVGAGGSLNLQVGGTYYIKLDAHTATQGYNQLESFINFPNTIFQVIEVKTNYTANTSVYVANTNDMLYADACLWDNVTTSPTYRSCIGSDGKSGGTVTTTYKVKILSGAGTTQPLNTLLYDFSGSSYHYNSDFSSGIRFAVISSPLTMTKSFTPTSITTSGGTSTLKIVIKNSSISQIDNVELTDNLPSGMTVALPLDASTSAGCVNASFTSPTLASIKYTGSVAGSGTSGGTCELSVKVTASPDGNYLNTTNNLLIDSNDTGIKASASLAVKTSTASCTSGTLAKWTFPSSFTTTAPLADGTPSVTVSAGGGSGVSLAESSASATSDGTKAWSIGSFSSDTVLDTAKAEYIQFAVNTTGMTEIKLKFDYTRDVNGPRKLSIYTGALESSLTDSGNNFAPSTSFVNTGDITFSSLNPSGTTYFRIYGYEANQSNPSADLVIDNVTFTGCVTASVPELSKSFSPSTIKVGETSKLTFDLKNPNASALTSVSFTDVLPAGMKVSTVPALPSNTCGATFNPAAGDTTINFTNGTIPGGSPGTCKAEVYVTVVSATTYNNISGYINSSAGINTTSTGYGTATLNATIAPPVVKKLFSPNPISIDGNSTLTFTITNPNQNAELTGVKFTDNFPAGLRTVNSPTTTCVGGVLTASTLYSIDLSGAKLAAGETCMVSVQVTSSVVSVTGHVNSVVVDSTEGGASVPSTDKLVVNDIAPKLKLLKEISTNPTGPWSDIVNVSAGANVYYRFTIENTGNVPLSPIWVTDNTLSQVSGCSWPATLPVASSTTDPTASCVVGPVVAQSGLHENIATAKGTYQNTVYSSNTSKAVYSTTSLVLTKDVSPTIFSAVNQQLTYTYTIKNTGLTNVSGAVSVTDSHAIVTCPQPAMIIPGGTVTCTAIYTITAQDLAIGSVTNTAIGSVGTATTNTVQKVAYSNKPDMVVSKVNTVTGGQAFQGMKFFWTLKVTNNGGASATFTNTKIVTDTLPAGPDYDITPTVNISGLTNNAGTVDCTLAGQLLSCMANGTVTIDPGKSFTVQIGVTPKNTGSLTNIATVDPDKILDESNEGNNNGSNIIAVSAPLPDLTITKTNNSNNIVAKDKKFIWTLTASNVGGASASFTDKGNIIVDTLPAGVTYDLVPTVTSSGITGTVNCTISGMVLSCKADGAVTIPVSGSIKVELGAIPTTVGTLSNTAIVNPDYAFAEGNTSNNADTDDVSVVLGTDLSITKTNNAVNVAPGGSTGYTIVVTNKGPNPADGAIFKDAIVTGLNVTSVTCGNALGGAICPAAGDTTVALMQGTGIVIPTLPSGGSVTFTVLANVSATSGSLTNTATIDPPTAIPDLDKTNNSASDTDPVSFSSVFDPPSALKTFNAAGIPELEFRMVWINNGNAAAIDVQVTDDIPAGTTYVPNSLVCAPQGISSTRNTNASSPLNTTLSSCAFDSTANGGLGRVQWQGTIEPDPGIAFTDPNAEANAVNEVVITFRVMVADTTNQVSNVASSRTDVDDDGNFDEEQILGTSILNSNQVVWSRSSDTDSGEQEELPDVLPKTGFTPNAITMLPMQPVEKAYRATDVWLEVPSLGLEMPIVGVPLVGDDWDVSWLWNEAGWLEGTAFPSWQGNSVLTSHVTLPNGEKGPFASLSDLSWGDRILIHAYGTVFTYEVRQNKIVSATDASVLRHEDETWLTLLTCNTYNEGTDTYTRRVAVRAALISVAKDKSSSGKNTR